MLEARRAREPPPSVPTVGRSAADSAPIDAPTRLDDRELDGLAVEIAHQDLGTFAANGRRVGESLGHVQGIHLGRLAAQQLVAEPDLPKAFPETDDIFPE